MRILSLLIVFAMLTGCSQMVTGFQSLTPQGAHVSAQTDSYGLTVTASLDFYPKQKERRYPSSQDHSAAITKAVIEGKSHQTPLR